MSWKTLQSLGLSISVIFGSFNLASTASAQATVPVTSTASQKHAALENLRQAHKLLVNADHDYDGHRARASEEVHKAIRELEGKHHAKKVVSGNVPSAAPVVKPAKHKEPAVHESQASSDEQLQQALQLLQSAQGEINSKHPKAAGNVTAAIREINTALKIK